MINYDDLTDEDLASAVANAESQLADIRTALYHQAVGAARRGDFAAERHLNMARNAISKTCLHLRNASPSFLESYEHYLKFKDDLPRWHQGHQPWDQLASDWDQADEM
jgi:hypothetical protein